MSTASSAAGTTSPRQFRSGKKAKPAESRLTSKAREKLIDIYLTLVGIPQQVVEGMLAMSDVGMDGLTLGWVDYDEGLA